MTINESNSLAIWDPKTPIEPYGIRSIGFFVSARAGIDWLVVGCLKVTRRTLMRSLGGLREVFA